MAEEQRKDKRISRKLVVGVIFGVLTLAFLVLVFGVNDKVSPGEARSRLEKERKALEIAKEQGISPDQAANELQERAEANKRRLAQEGKSIEDRAMEASMAVGMPTVSLPGAGGLSGGAVPPPPMPGGATPPPPTHIEQAKQEASKAPGIGPSAKPQSMVVYEAFDKNILGVTKPAPASEDEKSKADEAPQKRDANEAWAKNQGKAYKPGTASSLRAEAPSGKHMLMQGTILSGVMQTSLNTKLPGQVIVRLTQDVYDSIRGSTLLLPKGTKLIGAYNTDVNDGQTRVMMAANRLIYPSGVSVQLGAMPVSDATGKAGVPGEVNNYWMQRTGAALLLALIASATQPDNVTTVSLGGQQQSSAQQAASPVGEVLGEHLERVKTIRPDIDVAPGAKVSLILERDLDLPPSVTSGAKP